MIRGYVSRPHFRTLSADVRLALRYLLEAWWRFLVTDSGGRIRGEFHDGRLFSHVDEMKYFVEHWWMDYNHYWALSGPSYMTPTGAAEVCRESVVFGRICPCWMKYGTMGSSHRY
jgi:hypothetical protein